MLFSSIFQKNNKKYLDEGTKVQRKKIRDQSVFGTKQWGGKRQIIFPINRWLSQTRKMRRGPKFCSHILFQNAYTQKNPSPIIPKPSCHLEREKKERNNRPLSLYLKKPEISHTQDPSVLLSPSATIRPPSLIHTIFLPKQTH